MILDDRLGSSTEVANLTEEPGDYSCSKTTITIVRKSQTVLWVQEPNHQAKPACQKSDTKIHKWTIEDSLGWKRINRK